MLLQDTQLIETLAHFNRERIPERVVHARAVGAWGEFEVTHDISHLTDAKFLNGIGTKSKALIRVSTVGPGAGSADTLRDVRGWALKLFTEEGNQDFVFNDIVRPTSFSSNFAYIANIQSARVLHSRSHQVPQPQQIS
jgi:catalase